MIFHFNKQVGSILLLLTGYLPPAHHTFTQTHTTSSDQEEQLTNSLEESGYCEEKSKPGWTDDYKHHTYTRTQTTSNGQDEKLARSLEESGYCEEKSKLVWTNNHVYHTNAK